MVHWPEVMVSVDTATGVLFSADAFGKFGALCKTAFWADEDSDWACEGRRYYFNICGKYGPQVQALLKKVRRPAVDTICPAAWPRPAGTWPYYLASTASGAATAWRRPASSWPMPPSTAARPRWP